MVILSLLIRVHGCDKFGSDELGVPEIADRSTFQVRLNELRVREKAHRHEGDATVATKAASHTPRC
jgi:hypothetical protein